MVFQLVVHVAEQILTVVHLRQAVDRNLVIERSDVETEQLQRDAHADHRERLACEGQSQRHEHADGEGGGQDQVGALNGFRFRPRVLQERNTERRR